MTTLDSVVPEIFKGVKIAKIGHVTLTTPFSGQFVIVRLGHAMVNLYPRNLRSLPSAVTDRLYEMRENAQKIVVMGHPSSSAMSPFDGAHTISYSFLIETMRLSCTVYEIQRVVCRNSSTSTYPTCIWRPRWG